MPYLRGGDGRNGPLGALPPRKLWCLTEVPTEVALRVFGPELSMGKSMGLMSMVARVQRSARRYLVSRARQS